MACNIAVLKELKKFDSEWKAAKLKHWTPRNVLSGTTNYESKEAFVKAHIQAAEQAKLAAAKCATTAVLHGKKVPLKSGGILRADVKTWLDLLKKAKTNFSKEIQAITESAPSRKKLKENQNRNRNLLPLPKR